MLCSLRDKQFSCFSSLRALISKIFFHKQPGLLLQIRTVVCLFLAFASFLADSYTRFSPKIYCLGADLVRPRGFLCPKTEKSASGFSVLSQKRHVLLQDSQSWAQTSMLCLRIQNPGLKQLRFVRGLRVLRPNSKDLLRYSQS